MGRDPGGRVRRGLDVLRHWRLQATPPPAAGRPGRRKAPATRWPRRSSRAATSPRKASETKGEGLSVAVARTKGQFQVGTARSFGEVEDLGSGHPHRRGLLMRASFFFFFFFFFFFKKKKKKKYAARSPPSSPLALMAPAASAAGITSVQTPKSVKAGKTATILVRVGGRRRAVPPERRSRPRRPPATSSETDQRHVSSSRSPQAGQAGDLRADPALRGRDPEGAAQGHRQGAPG